MFLLYVDFQKRSNSQNHSRMVNTKGMASSRNRRGKKMVKGYELSEDDPVLDI